MGRRAKKLERFRQNPKNVRYEELESVLLYLGLEKRRGGGSHAVFSFPGHEPITIPVNKPFLKPTYVKQILKMIDELGLIDEE
ncbi:type II toxin-antitoxin system HicA family toxin [Chloroflexota bacterium]